MGYDLLTGGSEVAYAAVSKEFFYHFQFDRLLSRITSDAEARDFFRDVVSKPLCSAEDVSFRRGIMEDFLSGRSLPGRLRDEIEMLISLRDELKKIKRERFESQTKDLSSVPFARNQLQAVSFCALKVFAVLKTMLAILREANIKSDGLLAVKGSLEDHLNDEYLTEMEVLLNRMKNFSVSDTINLKIRFEGDGKILYSELLESRLVGQKPLDTKTLFADRRKLQKMATDDVVVSVYPKTNDLYDKLTVKAVSDLTNNLLGIAGQLVDEYAGMKAGLLFYATAISYVDLMERKGVRCVYPTFVSQPGTMIATGLYDVFLLAGANDRGEVVPNDCALTPDDGGMIVTGDNGSGKTVYMRSLALMQILAQAGLPVPAKEARLSIFGQMFSQFAGSENGENSLSTEGRFEQEVREISSIVDAIRPDAAVFLNETFQTTAYPDAAEGLYNILEFFCKNKITFLLVSHLKELTIQNYCRKVRLIIVNKEHQVNYK